jgi:hypothetical protein
MYGRFLNDHQERPSQRGLHALPESRMVVDLGSSLEPVVICDPPEMLCFPLEENRLICFWLKEKKGCQESS